MRMKLICSMDSECADLESFEKALVIWIKKPHVANRRLCGSEVIFEISWSLGEIKEQLFSEPVAFPAFNNKFANDDSLLKLTIRKLRQAFQLLDIEDECFDKTNYHVLLRRLISKNPKVRGSYELVIQSSYAFSPCAYFLTLCEDDIGDYNVNNFDCYAYKLSLDVTNKKIELYCHADYRSNFISSSCGSALVDIDGRNSVVYDNIKVIFPSISWLSDTLLRKVVSWSQEKCLDTKVKSLRLVNMGCYIEKYNELKEKYSKHLIEMWTESTDPLKFVYEDIGIAAYLLVFWKSLDEKECEDDSQKATKKSKVFIDLGCGNGLLVYLLNSEGHCGYGVDIRKRKIWESLKPVADLREFTVLPSEENPLPSADWLIGNHSDELTPWIPVMAARSQNEWCHYFVLPCCPWDFTSKFTSRKLNNGPKVAGKYEEYLNYIEEVGKMCGFKVERDTLRIPSTRRVCFTGVRLHEDSKLDRLKAIDTYVKSRCHLIRNASQKRLGEDLRESQYKMTKHENLIEKDNRVINFQPRSPGEAKRGSLNIDPSFSEIICVKVMEHLLKVENFVDVIVEDGTDINSKQWNKGGSIPLVEISKLCDANQLNILKSLPGGIQTVLKNCPDVFSIRNGEVTLRDWSSIQFANFILHRQKKTKQIKIKTRVKTKICFFYKYHPNKCLLKKEDCKFSHGIEDLNKTV